MDVRGHAAVVTGGASGLGRAAVRRLAAAGAAVAVLDRGPGDEVVAEVRTDGGRARAWACDVTDEPGVEQVLAEVAAWAGTPRVLVSCAGVLGNGALVGSRGPAPLERFARVVDVNLVGTFNVLRLVVEHAASAEPLATGERAVIVNTASVAAWDGLSGQTAYAASKGGVAAMTLPLARELGPLGIRVVAIAPGMFDTAMLDDIPEQTLASLLSDVPFPGRAGDPDAFGRFVLTCVENEMLDGEVVRLDGGTRMREPR